MGSAGKMRCEFAYPVFELRKPVGDFPGVWIRRPAYNIVTGDIIEPTGDKLDISYHPAKLDHRAMICRLVMTWLMLK